MTDEQERFEDHTRKINAAFAKALTSGRLSHDENADNYVGAYMWMGRRADGCGDAFKHSLTRKYLPT
tara:strand:- start:128 stop:328 length:201 start_codon:yes stop_codon:yes gene_type:complete